MPKKPVQPEITKEEIAKHYSAALDSVAVINLLNSKQNKTDDDKDIIKRNVDHLNFILSKTFWTTEDLSQLKAAAKISV